MSRVSPRKPNSRLGAQSHFERCPNPTPNLVPTCKGESLPKGEALTPGYNTVGLASSLSGIQAYVNAAFYNYLGKPSEVRLANGLSQRTNYFGLDTPTWFGPGQYGRTRQISGSRRTRTLQMARKYSPSVAQTPPRNPQRRCPP